MTYILFIIALFVLELFYFRVANHFNIIDKPNQRSSHTKITLRGGGIVIYFAALLYFIASRFDYPWFFMALTLISVISFADDIRPQSSKLRLVIHFIAMMLMFYQLNLFHSTWLVIPIALIIGIGILNAFNFMDGINGITGAYSFVVLAGLWYVNRSVNFVHPDFIIYILLGLAVFNIFNFRKKAKCFAGDVGAISIAFIVVFLLGSLILKTGNYSYILMLVVYGVDTILTIIHRIMLKENILEAHRKHVFQLMANELKIPHLVVSVIYTLLQGIITIGLIKLNEHPYIYSIIVTLLLMVTYIIIKKKYYYLHEQNHTK